MDYQIYKNAKGEYLQYRYGTAPYVFLGIMNHEYERRLYADTTQVTLHSLDGLTLVKGKQYEEAIERFYWASVGRQYGILNDDDAYQVDDASGPIRVFYASPQQIEEVAGLMRENRLYRIWTTTTVTKRFNEEEVSTNA